MIKHTDMRTAALLEHLLRRATFPDLESLVSAMVLYMQVKDAAPTSMSQNAEEMLSVFRQAAKRHEIDLERELLR